MSEHPPTPEPDRFAGLTTPGPHSIGTYISSLRVYPRQAWTALIACSIAMMLSPAGIVAATTTFFVGPIAAEFGWTETATLTLFTLPLMIVPFVLPFGGRWLDRWGVRRIAIPATALYALTTALTAVVGPSQPALGTILVISMGFGYIGCVIVVFKVVLVWFPHHRGMAFSSVGVLASLAYAAFSLVSQQLIGSVGWRATFVLLGLAILVLVVPTQFFLLSEPGPAQQAGDGFARADGPDTASVPAEVSGVPLRTAIRTRAWVFTALILAIAGGAVMGVSQNAVSMLGERGYSPELVSLSLSTQFLSSIVGFLLAGVVLDRAKSPWVLIPFVGCVLVALVIVATVQDVPSMLFLAMILLGVIRGAESTVGPYLVSRYFGPRSFAQLQGVMLGFCILVMGLAPIAVQAVREQTSSYSGPLLGLIIACAVALVMAFFLPRYSTPSAPMIRDGTVHSAPVDREELARKTS